VIVAILDDGAERELWLAKGWMSTGRGRSREKQGEAVESCKFTVVSEGGSTEVTKQGGKGKVEP
jgi:hypothetical protein